jgi:hypothetical protein
VHPRYFGSVEKCSVTVLELGAGVADRQGQAEVAIVASA